MTEAPALIRLTSPDGRLSAWIAPDEGAELCGLEWEGRELLWRGRDFSPTSGWTGRAPILWPAIGRTFAAGPEPTAETFKQAPLGWTIDGVDYPMPMHGFARSLPWRIEDQSADSLRLVLEDSDQTRKSYPFAFTHAIDYRLEDGRLSLSHQIKASMSNRDPMPFVLGNHATFSIPVGADGLPLGAVISNARHRMVLDAAGRPTGDVAPCETFAEPTPVDRIPKWDVIALTTGAPPSARLMLPDNLAITVGHQTTEGSRPGPEFVTLWGDPAAGYLSIEAWLGKPNALASGDGRVALPPGSLWRWTMTIDVHQGPRQVQKETAPL